MRGGGPWLRLAVIGVALFGPIAGAPESARAMKRTALTLRRKAAAQSRRGDFGGAIATLRDAIGYAEDAHADREAVREYLLLGEAYLRQGKPRYALAWINVAQLESSPDAQTRALKNRATSVLPPRVVSESVSGLYVRYAGRGYWASIIITDHKERAAHLQLLAYRVGLPWRKYGPGGLGHLEGQIRFENPRHAVYRENDEDWPDCRVEVDFSGNGATVTQQHDCGFGVGVVASGEYVLLCDGSVDHCDADELP